MFIRVLITLVLIAGVSALSADEQEALTIQRLTWAGVKFVARDTTVLVDAVGTDLWDGNAPGGLVPVEVNTRRKYALITHTHNDHLDIATLRRVLGDNGYVIAAAGDAEHLASRGLRVIPASPYKPVNRGGFSFIAVPAVDGFGAEQVSWIVSDGTRRYFHAGDTLWHGNWTDFGATYGPFDAVFLPINGARLQSDPPVHTPGTMTPGQAVDAALQLRARTLVPIHFGLNDPPFYTEVDKPLQTLSDIAARRDVRLVRLLPGEFLPLD